MPDYAEAKRSRLSYMEEDPYSGEIGHFLVDILTILGSLTKATMSNVSLKFM